MYYLPIQTKCGQSSSLPLKALFKRGGTIRAMYTWSIDGGAGMDDQLVIFTSNGECAIYAGHRSRRPIFRFVGVFRFERPMSKHSVVKYGGELYVLISTGLVPMSTMLRAETEQLGKATRTSFRHSPSASDRARLAGGWQAICTRRWAG